MGGFCNLDSSDGFDKSHTKEKDLDVPKFSPLVMEALKEGLFSITNNIVTYPNRNRPPEQLSNDRYFHPGKGDPLRVWEDIIASCVEYAKTNPCLRGKAAWHRFGEIITTKYPSIRSGVDKHCWVSSFILFYNWFLRTRCRNL